MNPEVKHGNKINRLQEHIGIYVTAFRVTMTRSPVFRNTMVVRFTLKRIA
jgi:hypothetical protein